MRIPLRRLLLHDLSKLHPVEVRGYCAKFHESGESFNHWPAAWSHHVTYNTHHPEHWGEQREMPFWDVAEMVADWFAAARCYDGRWPEKGKWHWFERCFPRLPLHPVSRHQARTIVEQVLKNPPAWMRNP